MTENQKKSLSALSQNLYRTEKNFVQNCNKIATDTVYKHNQL